MRKIMTALLLTAACGTTAAPMNGNNGSGSDAGSDTGSGMGSDNGSGSGSSTIGNACTSAADCGVDGACDLTQHECVAPAFAFDRTGFVDDGTRWWTNKSNATIHGTIANAAGQTLTAYINSTAVGVATITGTTWSIALPATSIAEAGTLVVVRMSSTSGDTIEQSQLFALDDKAPTAMLTGSVKDERGDQIDFSTGEAVHTHAGTAITLGGSGCPAVYKYAYLEDETAPAFGRQTSPNPLAWQIQVADSSGIDSMDSAYRVRDAAGHILYDWTSIQPDGSGAYAVTLYRNKIAALGTQAGHMFVDVRFRDPFGNESTTSACWDNHPMAAPLQISALARGEWFGWTLTADSPISKIMTPYGTDLFTQDLTQYAGEPVTISFALPTYSIPYTLAAVDDFAASPPVAASYTCARGMGNCLSTPPADPADSTTSGSLTSNDWNSILVDVSTNTALCTTLATGPSFTCTIPARAAGAAPHTYHLRLHVASQEQLKPFRALANDFTVFGEYTLDGLTYTGQPPMNATTLCTQTRANPDGTATCLQTQTYNEIRAADRITLQFPAIAETLKAAVNASATFESVTTAAGLTLAATTWDSGNDDLPGPQ